LPEANRFFNGKSVNVSKGGAFISVPMTTPVAAGNEIEINFPRTQTLAKEKGQYARIKKVPSASPWSLTNNVVRMQQYLKTSPASINCGFIIAVGRQD
jgi:hypothetical protein